MKRNSKLSTIIALILAMLMLLIFVGCQQSQAPSTDDDANGDEPITLVYQTTSADDVITKVFAEYQKTHQNVSLDVQVVDTDNFNTKVMSQISTNTLPDFFWWNASNSVGNFGTGALLDLSSYIDEKNFVEGTFTSSKTSNGELTLFPAEMQIQGFLINTRLFKELGLDIPETYDDLIKAAKVFRDNGKFLFGNGAADTWDTWGWYFWLELNGYLDEIDEIYVDGTKKPSESKLAETMYKFAELREAGAFSDSASTVTYEIAKTSLLAENCGIITTSTDWLAGILDSEQAINGDFQYWFGVTFPDSNADQNVCVKTCGNGYCVSADIEQAKLDAILDFFDYFYSQEGCDIALQQGMVLPVEGYESSVEVTPLVESIVSLTTDNSRTPIATVGSLTLAAVDGNTDIWIDNALAVDNMICGLIAGTITKDEIPDYMANYDAVVAKMISDYHNIVGE